MTRQWTLFFIATGALAVGVLVYVLDRRPEFVYFLPEWLSLNSSPVVYFGSIGNYLPTFVHVYAFILLTVIVAIPAGIKLISVCLTWFTLESLFEVAQIDVIAQWIARHTPDWVSFIPFLENTSNYFLMGTFDPLDLLSIVAGTLIAYLTITLISNSD